jgi:hypothetical protein
VIADVQPSGDLDRWRDGIELSTERATVPPGNSMPGVQVRMTVRVPEGAVSAKLGLRAESGDGVLVRTSSLLDLTVDEETEVSDPRVALTPRTPDTFTEMSERNRVRKVGNAYEVQVGATVEIPIQAQVMPAETAGGTYRVSAELEQPSGWDLGDGPRLELELEPNETEVFKVTLRNAGTSGTPAPTTTMTVRATKGDDEYVSFTTFTISSTTTL